MKQAPLPDGDHGLGKDRAILAPCVIRFHDQSFAAGKTDGAEHAIRGKELRSKDQSDGVVELPVETGIDEGRVVRAAEEFGTASSIVGPGCTREGDAREIIAILPRGFELLRRGLR